MSGVRQLCTRGCEGRQPGRFGSDHLVHHRPNLVERKERGCEWVKHHGVIDMLAVLSQYGFDRKLLHIDVGAVDRGALGRGSYLGYPLHPWPDALVRTDRCPSVYSPIMAEGCGKCV